MDNRNELDEIKKILDQHDQRISELEKQTKEKPLMVKKEQSIREFFLSKKPKGDVLKTLWIGYYLEKHEGFQSFNIKDIENGFKLCKEPKPTKLSDKIFQNCKRGFMMDCKEKKDKLKAWVLTNTGEGYVEESLKG